MPQMMQVHPLQFYLATVRTRDNRDRVLPLILNVNGNRNEAQNGNNETNNVDIEPPILVKGKSPNVLRTNVVTNPCSDST